MTAETYGPRTAAWQELVECARTLGRSSIKALFAADAKRFERFSLDAEGIVLDFSRQLLDARALESLLALAEQSEVPRWIELMFGGHPINNTEDRPALHVALRRPADAPLLAYGEACISNLYPWHVNCDLPLTTMALVQGDALGGGFEAALSATVVIAEESSRMGFPEVLFNLFPGMGAYSFLARRIDPAAAERMIFSGKIYTAVELHEMGVVDLLADDGTGEQSLYSYIKRNERAHRTHCAIYRVRRRVQPVTYEEMADIARIWVDTALHLEEPDLRKMERLIVAQNRRIERLGMQTVGAREGRSATTS